MASENQLNFIREYDKNHYDQVSVKLPKGTKSVINLVSDDSTNAFIRKAVLDRIYMIEHNMKIDLYEEDL